MLKDLEKKIVEIDVMLFVKDCCYIVKLILWECCVEFLLVK